MSMWIYLEIATGSENTVDIFDRNVTYNVTRILNLAWGGYFAKEIHERAAIDVAPRLRTMLAVMRDPDRREEFRKLEPANGWGSLATATADVEALHEACSQHPLSRVRVSE